MLDRNSYTSRCIQWVRLPLALMVVLGHSEASFDKDDPSVWINGFICWGLLAIAVPTFFMISGYLFFAGHRNFNNPDYISALKRRGRTLILPYILWILIGLICIHIFGHPVRDTPPRDPIHIFWANDWIRVQKSLLGYEVNRWGFPEGNSVLWFVRDLIVLFLFTPIIWWIARHTGKWIILILLTAYILQIGIPGISIDALYFFIIGACLAIFEIDFVRYCHRYAIPIILISLTCYVAYSLCVTTMDLHHIMNGSRVRLLASVSAILGTFAIFAIAARSLYPHTLNEKYLSTPLNNNLLALATAAFFIYCVHDLAPFVHLSKYINRLIPSERWSATITFFIFNTLRICIIGLLWWLMIRCTPRLLRILIGRRSL